MRTIRRLKAKEISQAAPGATVTVFADDLTKLEDTLGELLLFARAYLRDDDGAYKLGLMAQDAVHKALYD